MRCFGARQPKEAAPPEQDTLDKRVREKHSASVFPETIQRTKDGVDLDVYGWSQDRHEPKVADSTEDEDSMEEYREKELKECRKKGLACPWDRPGQQRIQERRLLSGMPNGLLDSKSDLTSTNDPGNSRSQPANPTFPKPAAIKQAMSDSYPRQEMKAYARTGRNDGVSSAQYGMSSNGSRYAGQNGFESSNSRWTSRGQQYPDDLVNGNRTHMPMPNDGYGHDRRSDEYSPNFTPAVPLPAASYRPTRDASTSSTAHHLYYAQKTPSRNHHGGSRQDIGGNRGPQANMKGRVTSPELGVVRKPTVNTGPTQMSSEACNKLNEIMKIFRRTLLVECEAFIARPPLDAKARGKEHLRLGTMVLEDTLLELDRILVTGDEAAKSLRKEYVNECNGVLDRVDAAAKAAETAKVPYSQPYSQASLPLQMPMTARESSYLPPVPTPPTPGDYRGSPPHGMPGYLATPYGHGGDPEDYDEGYGEGYGDNSQKSKQNGVVTPLSAMPKQTSARAPSGYGGKTSQPARLPMQPDSQRTPLRRVDSGYGGSDEEETPDYDGYDSGYVTDDSDRNDDRQPIKPIGAHSKPAMRGRPTDMAYGYGQEDHSAGYGYGRRN